MALQLGAPAAHRHDSGLGFQHLLKLTNACNSSFLAFWLLRAPCTSVMHGHTQKQNIHTHQVFDLGLPLR